MMRVPDTEELRLRLESLSRAANVAKARIEISQHFGRAEELEEIGFLTVRFAALEETIATYCETLLVRPELAGFHAPSKSVLARQFTEKLNLLTSLVTASCVLYDIEIGPVEQKVVALKMVGEHRNTIIHGMLSADHAGEITFRNRGYAVLATIDGLRDLMDRFQKAELAFIAHFASFYSELIAKKSTHPAVEATMKNVFASTLARLNASNKLRQSTLMGRACEAELNAATRKLTQSQQTLAIAKKAKRMAQSNLRREQKRARS